MIKFVKERFFNNPGSSIRNVYKLKHSIVTNADELVKVGKENWQEYIQSYRDGCDLGVIQKRIMNGDIGLLNEKQGFYGDVSNAPDSLQEALNAKIVLEQTFDNLPEEAKNKFGSVYNFLDSAGSEEWFKTLGVNIDAPKAEESEVTE